MAITTQKKQPKQNNRKATQSTFRRLLLAGITILAVGLLLFGVAQLFNASSTQEVVSAIVQDNATAVSVVNTKTQANQKSSEDVPIDVVDPETQYLGPPTDVANLSLAEAGQTGQPVLVWFHADW